MKVYILKDRVEHFWYRVWSAEPILGRGFRLHIPNGTKDEVNALKAVTAAAAKHNGALSDELLMALGALRRLAENHAKRRKPHAARRQG